MSDEAEHPTAAQRQPPRVGEIEAFLENKTIFPLGMHETLIEIPGKGREMPERPRSFQQAEGSPGEQQKFPASPENLLDGLQPHCP